MQEVRRVHTLDDLKEVLSILEKEDIEYKAHENAFLHENVYTKNLTSKEYVVLVNDEDRQKALDLFALYYTSAANDEESFLLKLDNEDLIEILANSAKYSTFEVNESKVILSQRGVIEAEQENLVKQKITKDNSPQKAKLSWIVVGYVFALSISLLGLAIGWYLYALKTKHSITNKPYKVYDSKSRLHGLLILFIGFIALVFYSWVLGVDMLF